MTTWNDNRVQYPRLLAEVAATMHELDIRGLAESMDLTTDEVAELFNRAQEEWDEIKASTPPSTVRLLVSVHRDPVPGAFHTEQDVRDGIFRILSDRIGHYEPKVFLTGPTVVVVPTRDERENTGGEFDDEFPDEHSHEPQDLSRDGEPRIGVYVTDDEGRHYYLEVKLTHEGLIADVYDRYGDENIATFARTYDELADFVVANDPLA